MLINLHRFDGAYEQDSIRRHERTGRPPGNKSFVSQLERALGRELAPKKPGRKSKAKK
ncbi:MAG: hypothetical protein R6U40_10455 [Desulfobacterales bacterium]